MVAVLITSNMVALERELALFQRERLPSIMRNALNDAAMDGRNAERDEIARVFDRPVALTKTAVVFPKSMKATKDNLVATIGMLRDEARKGTPPAKYLAPEVLGGPRRPKAHELALRRAGLLAPGEYVVPARGARLNSFGNISGSLITEILSQLKAAEGFAGYMMNETARSRKRAGAKRTKRYFVPPRGHTLPRGVYERQGNRIRAVLMFVADQPDYRPRYAFGQAGEKAVLRTFEGHWIRYFRREFPQA